MPLSLFTIIQAEDDLLARAIEGFEQLTRSAANVMHDIHQQVESQPRQVRITTDNEPARDSASSVTARRSLPVLQLQSHQILPIRAARPDSPRRSTAPDLIRPLAITPASDPNTSYAQTLVHPRPRNKSPYSRSHLRSRSANAPSMSQPMTRCQSLPARTTLPAQLSPSMGSSSPLLRSPARSGSPFRPASPSNAVVSTSSPSFYDGGFETIAEHAELDLSRSPVDRTNIASLNSSRPVNPRRRTNSPNRSPLTSSASSPSLTAQRFTEGFPAPALHHYGSTSSFASFNSMPSTPSDARSRSPSISSLETIEDAPDLEWEAIESDRIAKLKAAAEAEEQGESEGRRGGSLDIPSRSVGFGFGRGGARKRWSVCGAERRADLDLETIWED